MQLPSTSSLEFLHREWPVNGDIEAVEKISTILWNMALRVDDGTQPHDRNTGSMPSSHIS
jgi:hypothetical protein